jgi:serine protease Do
VAVAAALALFASMATGAGDGPVRFSGLAKRALPAVVNISATENLTTEDLKAKGMPGNSVGRDNPAMNEFLKELLEKRGNLPPELRVDAAGSGFIVDPEGYVVTNNHVVESASDIKLTLSDGREFSARRVAADPATDLALLKIDANEQFPTLEWGRSEEMEIGDWVIAIGSPFGLGGSVTAGLLSGRARDLNAGPYDDFLQTDAAINRGHSGGPLFNEDGKVVGVNTAILSPTGGSIGISFAIPSATAKPIVDQLREFGRVRRGQLGANVQSVTDTIAKAIGRPNTQGAMVASIIPDSPAEKAGLRPSDVIVQYNEETIGSFRDLPRLVAKTAVGSTATMKVWRDQSMSEKRATIMEQPAQPPVAAQPPPAKKPDDPQNQKTFGMQLERLSDEITLRLGLDKDTAGVLVTDVIPDGVAANEGIKAGDVIVEVDRKPVKSADEFAAQVAETRTQGQPSALMRINRNGQFRYVALPV